MTERAKMKRRSFLKGLFGALVSLPVVGKAVEAFAVPKPNDPSPGDVIYVDNLKGHDWADGSFENPVQSLKAAMDLVPQHDGQTQIFLNGPGPYSMPEGGFRSPSLGRAVTISGDSGWPPTTRLQAPGGIMAPDGFKMDELAGWPNPPPQPTVTRDRKPPMSKATKKRRAKNKAARKARKKNRK